MPVQIPDALFFRATFNGFVFVPLLLCLGGMGTGGIFPQFFDYLTSQGQNQVNLFTIHNAYNKVLLWNMLTIMLASILPCSITFNVCFLLLEL